MNRSSQQFILALSQSWLTRLYDPVQHWLFRESRFKAQLFEQARIDRGDRVLDIGCGTATLTLLIKKRHPQETG